MLPNKSNLLKYPCGVCKKSVKFGRIIACDHCNIWYHSKCIGMGDLIHDCHVNNSRLEFVCFKCGIPNPNTSLFDSSIQSTISDSSSTLYKNKAKKLRMLIFNFQGIWNKKETLHQTMQKYEIDIGSETHLDPSIHDSEIIPSDYIAFRKDREDGWGGVIIICKNNLIVKEIAQKTSKEIVAIKINTYQQLVIIISTYIVHQIMILIIWNVFVKS